MKTPPILQSDDDREASAQAARAQTEGTDLIRDHLNNHVEHNPGASSDYVSWVATLHPENAQVSIDERFVIPGNPWWTVYEQTKNSLPYATAVPIAEYEEDRQEQQSQSTTSQVTAADKENQLTLPDNNAIIAQPTSSPSKKLKYPHFCLRCNPVDTLVGMIFIFTTLLISFTLETIAFSFYLTGALFYKTAKAMEPLNIISALIYPFFMIFYSIFSLTDNILLLSSVLTTEVLNICSWSFGVIFGGILVADHRHQFTRRACHHLRWAFRREFVNPPRTFCGNGKTVSNSDDVEQEVHEVRVESLNHRDQKAIMNS